MYKSKIWMMEFVNTNYIPRIVRKPMFLEEKNPGLTAAEKGTAMHSVLQRLDLNNINSKEDINISN